MTQSAAVRSDLWLAFAGRSHDDLLLVNAASGHLFGCAGDTPRRVADSILSWIEVCADGVERGDYPMEPGFGDCYLARVGASGDDDVEGDDDMGHRGCRVRAMATLAEALSRLGRRHEAMVVVQTLPAEWLDDTPVSLPGLHARKILSGEGMAELLQLVDAGTAPAIERVLTTAEVEDADDEAF